MASVLEGRQSGILLHITSIPSDHGIGALGFHARRFADFLAESGQSIWQVLPLNPTDTHFHNSPYDSISAFACNPLLVSPEMMIKEGFLDSEEVRSPRSFPKGRVDYPSVTAYKKDLLWKAYLRFEKQGHNEEFQRFIAGNDDWLSDHALFVALKERFEGLVWNRWPSDIRDRHPDALRTACLECRVRIRFEQFVQYLFYRQWMSLKEYCNRLGIRIFGDLPIYVNYDSSDVWVNPDLFKLDELKRPLSVAGVPPDYFSSTGQLWGNPVYRWDRLKETRYDWWVRRLKRNLHLFDVVRIDHFRGFVAYWEVPADESTAIRGRWVQGPGDDFFHALMRHFPALPIVAEDLGLITQDVRDLMDRFHLPGMKVLLFAFNDDPATNPYAPHNHTENCLVYTGTHDNNTVRGWFETECSSEIRGRVERYVGRELGPDSVAQEMVRLASMSVAATAIVPLQDVLGLGAQARMNTPATYSGNWEWQLVPGQLSPETVARLREMTALYGRLRQGVR